MLNTRQHRRVFVYDSFSIIHCKHASRVGWHNPRNLNMSHELTERADGRIEYAFRETDGAGWHGLGNALPDGATIDQWTQAAGMEWKIARSRVRYGDAPNQRIIDDKHVLFRSDTKADLGIVSDKYQIVQPRAVLEFFRDLVRAGGLELSAAGTVFGGRRFWATAKIGDASPVSVRDKIGGYLLLSTSADGSLATEARLTSIRVVCRNTLAMARADGKPALRVSHRSVFDADAVKTQMGLNTAAWDSFRHSLTRLANKEVAWDSAQEIVAGLFATQDSQPARDKARDSAGWGKVMSLFAGEAKGSSFDGVQGTAYGLLQACTEYSDHWVRAQSAENRFVSAQWGNGATLKSKAYEALMAL
jgi:phage/plasmid-like protein (TIGR03299 family)